MENIRINKFIYEDRKGRARYIVLNYEKFLYGKILDVGCWERDLEKYLPQEINYTGIDIAGKPDVIVDLEKQKIPFPDNTFDCVVCTDVLEHLDNLHFVFEEIIRVSKKYVIISFPNNWSSYKKFFIKGDGFAKFYGLPIEKPDDRHKWFFNYEDSKRFVFSRQELDGYKVVSHNSYPCINVRAPYIKNIFKIIFKKIFGKKRFHNYFASAFWVVLKKNY